MNFRKGKIAFFLGGIALLTGWVLPALASDLEATVYADVQLIVDFGDAEVPPYENILKVEEGMTPKEVVSLVFPVLSGKSCCSMREVKAIQGVPVKPDENLWWVCRVNDNRDISPYAYKVHAGDRIEWLYLKEPIEGKEAYEQALRSKSKIES